jgi:hypothetical protein
MEKRRQQKRHQPTQPRHMLPFPAETAPLVVPPLGGMRHGKTPPTEKTPTNATSPYAPVPRRNGPQLADVNIGKEPEIVKVRLRKLRKGSGSQTPFNFWPVVP